MTRKHTFRRTIGTVALTGAALAAGLGASLSAFAEGKGIDEPFRSRRGRAAGHRALLEALRRRTGQRASSLRCSG